MRYLLNILILLWVPAVYGSPQGTDDFWQATPVHPDSIQSYTLIVFTGSDWCRNCIKLHESVLSNEEFMAAFNPDITPVLIDLPRNKKNQAEKEIREAKIKLAERFNPNGQFPFIVLVDDSGKKVAGTTYISDNWEDYITWLFAYL